MAIVVPGVQVVILNFRGEGKFCITPQYADEIDNGEIISPQNLDRPPFNSPMEIFETKEEMVRYIKAIV